MISKFVKISAILPLVLVALSQALTNSPPLTLTGKMDVVLTGLKITNPNGPCIFLNQSENIRVENSELGPCKDEGVKTWRSKNVTVAGNYMESVSSGVNAIESQTILVQGNSFLNMAGPFPRGQFVQFNTVTGPGNRILDNVGENILGSKSYPEDMVNMYGSHGLVSDPILIAGNKFRGGGPSKSGGGLMTGDKSGSYIVVKNNILVNPGNYAISIAGGHHIQLLDNLIYQESKPWSNYPAQLWDWQHLGNCTSHIIRGNKSTYYNHAGKIASLWFASGNCKADDISGNDWNAGLSANILPADLLGLIPRPFSRPGPATMIQPGNNNTPNSNARMGLVRLTGIQFPHGTSVYNVLGRPARNLRIQGLR